MTITTKTGKSTNLSRLTKATNGERTIMPGQNDGIVPTGEVLNAVRSIADFNGGRVRSTGAAAQDPKCGGAVGEMLHESLKITGRA